MVSIITSDLRCTGYKKENDNEKQTEKMTTTIKNSMEYVIIVVERATWVKTTEKENSTIKNMRKQKRPLTGMKMIWYYVHLQWRWKNKK